jgi:hypothetical protein
MLCPANVLGYIFAIRLLQIGASLNSDRLATLEIVEESLFDADAPPPHQKMLAPAFRRLTFSA